MIALQSVGPDRGATHFQTAPDPFPPHTPHILERHVVASQKGHLGKGHVLFPISVPEALAPVGASRNYC